MNMYSSTANPILVDMRAYYEDRMLPLGVVANAFLLEWRNLFVVEAASIAHRNHARRVLTRLAAL